MQVEVHISPSTLQSHEYLLKLNLSNSIVSTQCQIKFFSSKMEVKLAKSEAIRWSALEGEPRVLKRKL